MIQPVLICSCINGKVQIFRIVRFKITKDTYETVLTNLSRMEYPEKTIKDLYASEEMGD